MSYSIYDADNYIGDLYSAGMLVKVRRYIETQKSPLLNELLENGTVEISHALLAEIKALKVPKDQKTKDALNILFDMIKKSRGVVIITDGTDDEAVAEAQASVKEKVTI